MYQVIGKDELVEAADMIFQIGRALNLQLKGSNQWLTEPECRKRLCSVAKSLDDRLGAVAELAKFGQIYPFRQLALSECDAPVPTDERPLRVGVYPLAANPMHWGHILVALTAMASIRLDKVVFIIAGADGRKPSMLSADTRHRLGRSVIEMFCPLFAYSPLALDTDLDGETNFGRLLRLNSYLRVDAFYIAGADHYRRTTPEGDADTIAKLERVFEKQGGNLRHTISAVFVGRNGAGREVGKVDTFLDVHFLPPIPLSLSSTAVRRALCREDLCEASVSLPYSCLLEIRRGRLYGSQGNCAEAEDCSAEPSRLGVRPC